MPVLITEDYEEESTARHGIKASSVLTDRDPKPYWPPCDHDDGYLRVHVFSNKTKHYKFQCLTCGKRGSAIRHDHWLIGRQVADPPPIDADLEMRVWREQSDEKNAAWWSWYTTYLQSDAWRRRSQRVIARDHAVCRAQFDNCQNVATQAHHLTYAHVGNEPLFDLIAICASCHDVLTALDRDRKAAA